MIRAQGRDLRMFALMIPLVVAGCGARRPVLYPNEHYNAVGEAAAQRDIDECMMRAKAHIKSGGAGAEKAKDVARQTGFGAASGAAIGAVGGAVGGGGAGRGAATGAATGATAGLIHGLFGGFFGPREPDPLVANYVDRCLREKGYELVGWR